MKSKIVSTTAVGAWLALQPADGLGFTLTNVQHAGATTTYQHPTRSDSYYIHYTGSEVTNISAPFALRLGGGSPATVFFNSNALRAFFRTAEVPLNAPLDTDQDGIDDVYELLHSNILDPLNSTDGGQDADGDGDSNYMEYACRQDPADYWGRPYPLNWSKPNFFGIQVDANQGAWHAGRVTDVLANGTAGIVIATQHGGAWSITHQGFAIPLSDAWDQPDLNSLAYGPDGAGHFFAGGGGLYETDVTAGFPVLNWRELPKPFGLGAVYRLVVVPGLRRLVAAGQGGVWWSPIPNAGTGVNGYSWRQARGLPPGTYSGLALGPNNTVIAAALGSDPGSGLYGLWRGTWSGNDLNFARANISGADPTQMYQTKVASCDGDRSVAYAIAAGADNFLYTLLRTADGGQNWAPTGQTFEDAPAGYSFRFAPGNQAKDRNLCIAVAPNNANRVAFGVRRGPFTSVNGGSTWRGDAFRWNAANPDNPDFRSRHSHGDIAAVYFDPTDGSGASIYVGSDGGIIRTPDMGATFSSDYNRNLGNLDCVNPSGARYWYGTLSVSSQGGDLIIGTGSQDNGNIYCSFDPAPSPWTQLDGGDGQLMQFLQTGDLLRWHNGDVNVRRASWDSVANRFSAGTYVDLMPLYPFTFGAMHVANAVVEAIEAPNHLSTHSQLMYGVAGRNTEVYGVFGDANGANTHLELLGLAPLTQGEYISGIGSHNGDVIYFGSKGGKLFRLDSGGITQATVPPVPPGVAASSVISKIVFFGPTTAFALYHRASGIGSVYRTFDGRTWTEVTVDGGNGLPQQGFYSLAADTTTSTRQLFVAADDQVYASFDAGGHWKRASGGLPRRPHSSDLRIATHGNQRHLYLSTLGHSVWRAQLADYAKYPLTTRGTPFSGNFVQSTWGNQGDFDLLVPRGDFVFHYSRKNDENGLPWRLTACLPPYKPLFAFQSAPPRAASLIQGRLGNLGYPGNLEAVVRMDPIADLNGTRKWLAHYYYDSVARKWIGPTPIEADGQEISGVTGDPALIQSTWGANGNFELLVPMGNHVAHFYRDNDDAQKRWHRNPNLPGAGAAAAAPEAGVINFPDDPIDVAFIQSNFAAPGNPGNFEAIVHLRPRLGVPEDYLAFYYFDSTARRWFGPFDLVADGQLVRGVTGAPALLQSTWGTQGNFELLVPMGNHVAHFWRDNDAPGFPWHRNPDLPRVGSGGQVVGADPLGVAFLQSNFIPGGGSIGNFEAVVRLSPRLAASGSDYVAFYYLDSVARRWFGPFDVQADGQFVYVVTGF